MVHKFLLYCLIIFTVFGYTFIPLFVFLVFLSLLISILCIFFRSLINNSVADIELYLHHFTHMLMYKSVNDFCVYLKGSCVFVSKQLVFYWTFIFFGLEGLTKASERSKNSQRIISKKMVNVAFDRCVYRLYDTIQTKIFNWQSKENKDTGFNFNRRIWVQTNQLIFTWKPTQVIIQKKFRTQQTFLSAISKK